MLKLFSCHLGFEQKALGMSRAMNQPFYLEPMSSGLADTESFDDPLLSLDFAPRLLAKKLGWPLPRRSEKIGSVGSTAYV